MSIKTLEIIYRKPLEKEATQISDLFTTILDTNFPMFPSEAKLDYKKNWSIAAITARIQQNQQLFLSAYYQEKPIGLVHGTSPEAGVGTIIWLLVENNYQNNGVGIKLLELAKKYYQDLNCHKVKLTAPSEQAKNFYEKQGMIAEGYHPKHWWNTNFWSLGMAL